MEPNFHQGRVHAGWTCIKTLEKHKLVERYNHQGHYHEGGGFTAERHRFALTAQGRNFVQQLLRKFPEPDEPDAPGQTRPITVTRTINSVCSLAVLPARSSQNAQTRLSAPKTSGRGVTSASFDSAAAAHKVLVDWPLAMVSPHRWARGGVWGASHPRPHPRAPCRCGREDPRGARRGGGVPQADAASREDGGRGGGRGAAARVCGGVRAGVHRV
eukprot:1036225-Prorocentrum_minimum.AAC.3